MKVMINKEFDDLPAEFKKAIPTGTEVYEAIPTPDSVTGLSGRVAVMEVLAMNKDIEQVILKNGTELEIAKVARARGMLTMKEDAIIKAFARVIPFEEVNTL
jgi:type II secretory ATPase GspE/PulE/Tfp pilus assembly ATPase PilB-like protein